VLFDGVSRLFPPFLKVERALKKQNNKFFCSIKFAVYIYNRPLINRFRECGHSAISAKIGTHTFVYPKQGGKDICLAWALQGSCSSNCCCATKLTRYNAATLPALHTLFDVCGVHSPASTRAGTRAAPVARPSFPLIPVPSIPRRRLAHLTRSDLSPDGKTLRSDDPLTPPFQQNPIGNATRGVWRPATLHLLAPPAW
jgi:hypothetical protein